MLKELYTAAMGMLPQQTRLEVLSNNIANAGTAGFKRESVFERNLIDSKANLYNVAGDAEEDDAPVGSAIDFRPGSFRQTENPFDIAVEGDGFFMLQDEDGNISYTRSGHFKLSADGTIVAMDGKMLMGESGPISIANEFTGSPAITGENKAIDFRVTTSGEIFANDFHIGNLAIAQFENPQSLQRISNQNFVPSENAVINYLPGEEISVRQGWIEESNVNVIKEMVEMIELQRMFEAGTKVIQTNDRTLDDTIRTGRYY